MNTSSPEPKLLPCPWCNCIPTRLKNNIVRCDTEGCAVFNHGFNLTLWNTRPTPNAASGEVDDVRIEQLAREFFACCDCEMQEMFSKMTGRTFPKCAYCRFKQAILEATKDLMEDKKRLNWLDGKLNCLGYSKYSDDNVLIELWANEPSLKTTLRTAISTAMEVK